MGAARPGDWSACQSPSGSTGDRTPDQWIKNTKSPEVSAQARGTIEPPGSEDDRLRTVSGPSRGDGDPVEIALATAIERASAAGEWAAVGQLARELEARRLAAQARVVDIGAERRNRER